MYTCSRSVILFLPYPQPYSNYISDTSCFPTFFCCTLMCLSVRFNFSQMSDGIILILELLCKIFYAHANV